MPRTKQQIEILEEKLLQVGVFKVVVERAEVKDEQKSKQRSKTKQKSKTNNKKLVQKEVKI